MGFRFDAYSVNVSVEWFCDPLHSTGGGSTLRSRWMVA
jgi:hypothetical protein